MSSLCGYHTVRGEKLCRIMRQPAMCHFLEKLLTSLKCDTNSAPTLWQGISVRLRGAHTLMEKGRQGSEGGDAGYLGTWGRTDESLGSGYCCSCKLKQQPVKEERSACWRRPMEANTPAVYASHKTFDIRLPISHLYCAFVDDFSNCPKSYVCLNKGNFNCEPNYNII